MNHFQQSVIVDATPTAVYAALTTPQGLQGWWTQDCDITARIGDTIHFRFGPHHKQMRIDRLEPGREVAWSCTAAHIAAPHLTRPDEWVGTRIVFRLLPEAQGRTILEFEHIGLEPGLQCYEMCNRGWRHFLVSLQQYAATGRGTPYEIKTAAAA